MSEEPKFPIGHIGWKSISEHNQRGLGHGEPYYYITCKDDMNYFWKLDTETTTYQYVKSSENFRELAEEGQALDEVIREENRRKWEGPWDWENPLETEEGE